jgi:hypothetical protein
VELDDGPPGALRRVCALPLRGISKIARAKQKKNVQRDDCKPGELLRRRLRSRFI